MVWKHALRRVAAATLDAALPYTSYGVDAAEYLGRYDGETAALMASLRKRGYSYRLLAATERHSRRDEMDAAIDDPLAFLDYLILDSDGAITFDSDYARPKPDETQA